MALPINTLRSRAHQFVLDHENDVKENAESQSFLNDFFAIFDIQRKTVGSFELAVKTEGDKSSKRIDLLWPGTLLVEMKSAGQDLAKAFQQAVDYLKRLNDQDKPVYILVCDLQNFRLHNIETQQDYSFTLAELPDNLDLFGFMHGKVMQNISEYELNEKAALLLGDLHDSLRESGFEGHPLQVFMVRILFCLFAEDTGVFNPRQFVLYLLNFTREDGSDTELHLQKLFQVLDTPNTKRNKGLAEEQADFPYVNGQLFKERIDMPSFTAEMREMLINCCLFNWKEISPAIFGSLFQSIMDKQTRRNLGAHYTSEQNILKVIEPLFLDDLKAELAQILELKVKKTRNSRLMAFVEQLRNLKFLDPACGCGNFLIVTYRELRRLELQVFEAQHSGSGSLALEIQPQVPLDNFYGIELDEWPARIAEVAMWLTQHQMNVEFAKAFGKEPDLLPLKEHANIHYDNALTLDWHEVVQQTQLNYIIGNPPFLGKNFRTKEQETSQEQIFAPQVNSWKTLDFVASWFYKAAVFSKNTTIETGFVSTNSITMGEQVGVLWQALLDMGVHINFAHRTFAWSNDARGKAAVHCIVVGFAQFSKVEKYIFDYPDIKGTPIKNKVDNINPYLVDAPNQVVKSRVKPLSISVFMDSGNKATDGGFLFLTPQEKDSLLAKYPELDKWIKRVTGAQEFLNKGERYCLWLAEASTRDLRELMQLPEIAERIEGVKQMRLNSPDKGANKLAETPWKFRDTRTPETYILMPQVSSERRLYIPMGFLTKDTILTSPNLMIPNATLHEFGILTSEMHMDWMRVVAGRLKSDYRYSAKLVYNNFPWPETTDKQKQQIEKLAQAVLDARQIEFDKDPETSLADLYDPDLMPPILRKAHSSLDKAVDKLYQTKGFKTPMERVQCLFQLYAKATGV